MLMLRVLTPREVTIAPAKMDMLVMERSAPVNSKNSVLMKFNCRRAPLEIQQIEDITCPLVDMNFIFS